MNLEKSKLFRRRLKQENESAVTILSGKRFQISTTLLEKKFASRTETDLGLTNCFSYVKGQEVTLYKYLKPSNLQSPNLT